MNFFQGVIILYKTQKINTFFKKAAKKKNFFVKNELI